MITDQWDRDIINLTSRCTNTRVKMSAVFLNYLICIYSNEDTHTHTQAEDISCHIQYLSQLLIITLSKT